MGSFSWLRADITTERANLTDGDHYKILIPKEFGGGYIKDIYEDYGNVFYYDETKEVADLYGILAYWNHCEDMDFNGDEYPKTMKDILERGRTNDYNNREKGIAIGCYDWQIAKLKYPLKLVSSSYKGTYEDCQYRSYVDGDQGFFKTYWRQYRKWMRYKAENEEVNKWKQIAYDEMDAMVEAYHKRVEGDKKYARRIK